MKKLLLTALSVLAVSTANAESKVFTTVPKNTFVYAEAAVGPIPFPIVGGGIGIRHKFNNNYAIDASLGIRSMIVISEFEQRIDFLKYLTKNKSKNFYTGVGISAQQVYAVNNGDGFWVRGIGPQILYGRETVSSEGKMSFGQLEMNCFHKVSGSGFNHVSVIPEIVFRVGKSF